MYHDLNCYSSIKEGTTLFKKKIKHLKSVFQLLSLVDPSLLPLKFEVCEITLL